MNEKYFLLKGYDGGWVGEIYYRDFDLAKFITRMEKEHNWEIIGINFEPDKDNSEKLSSTVTLVYKIIEKTKEVKP